MSEPMRWRVTGPNGFDVVVVPTKEHNMYGALCEAWREHRPMISETMLQAGYRAEPIEEPKMVTVRAEDVEAILAASRWFPVTRMKDNERDAVLRLCAVLESAK